MRFVLATLVCATALFAVEPGQRAPGFALPDPHGNVIDLYDFHGKPVIVEFMNTGCPHCAAFAASLQKAKAKYGDRIGIISIANPPDTITAVAEYVKGHDITYPVVFDSGQAAWSYVRQMHFDLPQVYLVDPNGIIFNHYGYSILTKEFFEGDALVHEIDRMMGTGGAPAAGSSKGASKKK